MSRKSQTTYAAAGVNIDAGNALVDRIKPLARATARAGSVPALGGFGALFDLAKTGYRDPLLVATADGVGTKLKVALAMDRHDTIGIDLVAMCVNDLAVQGAEPFLFQDYLATGKLEVEQARAVIQGIAEGCREAGCALVGGETAEMPGMYHGGDYDIAGFAVGAVERESALPRADIRAGDVLLALPSSGVHSNGFSLVRHIAGKQNIGYRDIPPGLKQPLGEILLTPTRIYVRTCLALAKLSGVKAFAHITGGGLTDNIPRVLPETLAAEIDCSRWKLPEIFAWIANAGNIGAAEMLRTFNCGAGMAVVATRESVAAVEKLLKERKEDVFVLGEIVRRPEGGDGVIYRHPERLSA